MSTVLPTATRAVLDACERLGLDRAAITRGAGVDEARLRDPDCRLPTRAADAVWREASVRANDPLLALHAAEALPFGAYRVIDFIAANSATVGAALERVATYFGIVESRATLEVSGPLPAGEGGGRSLTLLPADVRPSAQEYTFAALVTRMRHCADRPWGPSYVELTFEAPAARSEHQRVFGGTIRYLCAAPRMLFSKDAWETPISSANPELLAVLDAHARRLVAELPRGDDLVERARSAIGAALGREPPTLARVARALATSERTLQRRLKERGRTLDALVDEVRAAAAKAHLADQRVSSAEIAFLLGFSDQSAFTRAFRRWTNTTPSAFRGAQRSRAAPAQSR